MALKAFLIALAVVSMVVAPAMATEHLVGMIKVGKKCLKVFKYKEGVHNVFKADLISFQDCAPSTTVTSFNTGNDVIELTYPGKKWYFCGIRGHCDQGMKLAITVLPVEVGSPNSSPPASSTAFGISPNYKFIVALFAVFLMIIA
ncbi:blue copper protein 1a-like [Lycium barbarum]|uniref:blue copper protein 1a-like n=1 Tax=Lycium barbarum TaxID=112863 RepID=UPI00293F4812|nr:blue copper protein 1a-like [Lycium barbarum]